MKINYVKQLINPSKNRKTTLLIPEYVDVVQGKTKEFLIRNFIKLVL